MGALFSSPKPPPPIPPLPKLDDPEVKRRREEERLARRRRRGLGSTILTGGAGDLAAPSTVADSGARTGDPPAWLGGADESGRLGGVNKEGHFPIKPGEKPKPRDPGPREATQKAIKKLEEKLEALPPGHHERELIQEMLKVLRGQN